MPAPTEDELRDFLAPRLGTLVEPGLTLIAKEFSLPNFHGAKGFIDILARDQFGMTVIIELKRSDSAARQALHELHKYTALLQEAHGLGPSQTRCIVLSTDWHELLVPFSSFTRQVPYAVTGYRLLTDEHGQPTGVKTIDLLPEAPELELCPSHGIYLFSTRIRRDAFVPDLVEAIERCAVEDYLLVSIEHSSAQQRVMYPFALYFAMAAIDPVHRLLIESQVGIVVDPDEESEGDDWFFEESVQAEINRAGPHSDDFEIGYPDKFSAHEDTWSVSEIKRFGRFASDVLRSDNDLLALIRAESREHTVRFKATATPQYGPAWGEMRESLRVCLVGSGPWEQAVEFFLNEAEAKSPSATVEVAAFNPCDLLMALCKVVTAGSPLYFPTLSIVVAPPESDTHTALVGILEWDGSTCPQSFRSVVVEEFAGDLFDYFIRRQMNELWPLEQRLAKLHGLSYGVHEVEVHHGVPSDKRRRVLADGSGVTRQVPSSADVLTFFDFCESNETYLRELAAIFSEMAIGL